MTSVYSVFSMYIYLFGYTPDLLFLFSMIALGRYNLAATSLFLSFMGFGSVFDGYI